MVEMAIHYVFNVQRVITPKVGKTRVTVQCSAHRLMMFHIAVKFGENISKGISYGANMK